MDFALIFGIYLFVCCCAIVCYLMSTFLQYNPFCKLCSWLAKAGEKCLPEDILRIFKSAYLYLFFQRNPVFLCVYLFLLFGTHTVAFTDVLPYLYSKSPQVNHTFWMLLFLVMNLICFAVCSCGDPGIITGPNLEKYRPIYTPDGQMYQHGRICELCGTEKLARSKHCVFTNRCIFRYDHYCILTGSAIGGLTYRYFFGLLVSVCAMCINGVVLCIQALLHIIDVRQLWRARYIDAEGKPQPMNYPVLIQTLFMQQPRLVILLAAITVIMCGIMSFTAYHVFLILRNQTTRERYLLAKQREESFYTGQFYNKGVLANVIQCVFPLRSNLAQNKELIVQKTNSLTKTSKVQTNTNKRRKKTS